MTTKQKGELISNIIVQLKFMATTERKAFDYGDTFFTLAFRTDEELQEIAKICGI